MVIVIVGVVVVAAAAAAAATLVAVSLAQVMPPLHNIATILLMYVHHTVEIAT
jgi:hypothetical protein